MTGKSSLTSAIAAWKKILGEDRVMDDDATLKYYTQAACGSRRDVVSVVFPNSHEEVECVVAIANEFRTPLYPISRGKQWGMGSRLPVRDGATIMDLSRMDSILEVNEQFHYAVVEPGVTQKQLIDHIESKGLKLMLNVTGSTSDTSLIGNAMDRGVGYFDSRAHGFSNLCVVLGNGETIQTGFGHYENAKTKNLYSHGVGPSLDGLFPQANFGIVTSACIDLMPLPEGRMTAALTIDSEEKLPALVDALVDLRRKGFIHTIAHVGNRERSHILFAPLIYEQLVEEGHAPGRTLRARVKELLAASAFGPWTAGIGMLGSHGQLQLAKKEIKSAMRRVAKVRFLDDGTISRARVITRALAFIPFFRRQKLLLSAIDPIYGFTQGETTDKSLVSVYWAAEDYERLMELDPDHSDSGILFCLPIIPADGQDVARIVQDTRETFAKYSFEAAITVNLMNSKSMEGVVSLAFDRCDAVQAEKARTCIQEMESVYMEMGYPPYRVGINSMGTVVSEADAFWRVVRDLKKTLDPNNIIAPGRYNLV